MRNDDQEERDQRVPFVGMDYGSLGKACEKTHQILIIRDSMTGCTCALWVPTKGTSEDWVIKKVVNFLDGLGYPEIVLKRDQEPSIIAVQEAVKTRRRQHTILENSPVGESRSNGLTEKAVQEVTGMVRAFLDQAGVNLNAKRSQEDNVENSGPLIAWLAEHEATAITRAKVGIDGKTPYQGLKGNRFITTPPMWFERVLFKPV